MIIVLLGVAWSYVEEYFKDTTESSFKEISSVINSEELKHQVGSIIVSFQSLLAKLDEQFFPDHPSKEIEKPVLNQPKEHVFSIYNIEIGAVKAEVEASVGEPQRLTLNEYGKHWSTYHEDYRNFMNVMYDENDYVIGLYTNQDLIASTVGITLGSSKDEVRQQLGDPMTGIRKGLIIYQYQQDAGYDVFNVNESYVTIFYDIHENDTVTAIQIIEEQTEKKKAGYYADASEELKKGLEYQLFDVTNATRVVHNLSLLTWDDNVKKTARAHSLDMAENHYFNHTNLRGQSPFDRMEEDELAFTMAGENLAYGQISSIFAHEGLMNSLGHRENILQSKYQFLGVGVAFNSENHPYYTENFYRK